MSEKLNKQTVEIGECDMHARKLLKQVALSKEGLEVAETVESNFLLKNGLITIARHVNRTTLTITPAGRLLDEAHKKILDLECFNVTCEELGANKVIIDETLYLVHK